MDSSLSLPPEYYDEDGNFNLKDFPRAVQAVWDREDIADRGIEQEIDGVTLSCANGEWWIP
jgi:hypothetical protein